MRFETEDVARAFEARMTSLGIVTCGTVERRPSGHFERRVSQQMPTLWGLPEYEVRPARACPFQLDVRVSIAGWDAFTAMFPANDADGRSIRAFCRQGLRDFRRALATKRHLSLIYPPQYIDLKRTRCYRHLPGKPRYHPRYPVYVISKGRWKLRHTSRRLELAQISYRIVVEPSEAAAYTQSVDDPRCVLVLPENFSERGHGSIPARNWVLGHARASGHAKHWLLDDNLTRFFRFHRNELREVTDAAGALFHAIETFVDRYDNIALAGMHDERFTVDTNIVPPYYMNTRVYSCMLLDHALMPSDGWRGRYNEDTDLTLRVLKEGYATVLFNTFLMHKSPTMVQSGGNTDTVYRNDPTRWDFATSLRDQHPDVVRVVRKFKRWHHQVDYSPFANNRLRPRRATEGSVGVHDNMHMIPCVLYRHDKKHSELPELTATELAEAHAHHLRTNIVPMNVDASLFPTDDVHYQARAQRQIKQRMGLTDEAAADEMERWSPSVGSDRATFKRAYQYVCTLAEQFASTSPGQRLVLHRNKTPTRWVSAGAKMREKVRYVHALAGMDFVDLLRGVAVRRPRARAAATTHAMATHDVNVKSEEKTTRPLIMPSGSRYTSGDLRMAIEREWIHVVVVDNNNTPMGGVSEEEEVGSKAVPHVDETLPCVLWPPLRCWTIAMQRDKRSRTKVENDRRAPAKRTDDACDQEVVATALASRKECRDDVVPAPPRRLLYAHVTVLVVSLDHSVGEARRARFATRVPHFTVVPGYTYEEVPVAFRTKLRFHASQRRREAYRQSQVAVAYSHYQALVYARDVVKGPVIICEDDAWLREGTREGFREDTNTTKTDTLRTDTFPTDGVTLLGGTLLHPTSQGEPFDIEALRSTFATGLNVIDYTRFRWRGQYAMYYPQGMASTVVQALDAAEHWGQSMDRFLCETSANALTQLRRPRSAPRRRVPRTVIDSLPLVSHLYYPAPFDHDDAGASQVCMVGAPTMLEKRGFWGPVRNYRPCAS